MEEMVNKINEHKKSKVFKVVFAILIFLGALFLKNTFIDQPLLVTIQGEGRIKIKPEIAKFTINIVKTGENTSNIQRQNEETLAKAIAVLNEFGVNEQDIAISNIEITPSPLVANLYQSSSAINTIIRNLDNYDEIIKRLYNAGIEEITGTVFTVNDSTDLEREVSLAAVKDAEKKVKETEKSFHKRVKKLVSVQIIEMGDEEIFSSPTETEFTRQVFATFELK
jgi:uncharacterized protein YggE